MFQPSRRAALQQTAAGFGSLALSGLLAEEARARPALVDPLEHKQPHFEPKAKRVIFLFMTGGPSQVDTFEHKPLLERDHGKPYPFAKPKVQFAPTNNLLRSPWNFKP